MEFSPITGGGNSLKYMWFTYSLKFWGIFHAFSGIYPFFWGKSPNYLAKSMFTLKCGIFLNNGWENSPKYMWFTYSLNFWGIFHAYFGIYPFFGGKSRNSLGKSMFTLKCGIFPNNGCKNFPNFLLCTKHLLWLNKRKIWLIELAFSVLLN